MVNLRNRQPPPAPPAPPARGRAQGGRAAMQGQGRGAARGGRAVQPGPPNPPNRPNHYHDILTRMGLSVAAITGLENLGLDDVQAFNDLTEKDIPSIIKELRRGNVLVRQTSQNYLQAL
jgi:hypothetical protein